MAVYSIGPGMGERSSPSLRCRLYRRTLLGFWGGGLLDRGAALALGDRISDGQDQEEGQAVQRQPLSQGDRPRRCRGDRRGDLSFRLAPPPGFARGEVHSERPGSVVGVTASAPLRQVQTLRAHLPHRRAVRGARGARPQLRARARHLHARGARGVQARRAPASRPLRHRRRQPRGQGAARVAPSGQLRHPPGAGSHAHGHGLLAAFHALRDALLAADAAASSAPEPTA
jgi:hypothetical protein